jgi:hypothetical protein
VGGVEVAEGALAEGSVSVRLVALKALKAAVEGKVEAVDAARHAQTFVRHG